MTNHPPPHSAEPSKAVASSLAQSAGIRSFRLAGTRIDAVTLKQTLVLIEEWIAKRERRYIVLVGAHGLVELQASAALRAIYENADLAPADGVPIVWLGRLSGHRLDQVCGSNLMRGAIAAGISKNHRHLLYGGRPGVSEALARRLREQYPGALVQSMPAPPFRPLTAREETSVIEAVNAAHADIVWVALGCPKQEHFIGRIRPHVNAPVLVGVGATFDFLSGRKRRAPTLVSAMGFEWLFRALTEGRRLRRRYLRVVFRIVPLLVKDAFLRL